MVLVIPCIANAAEKGLLLYFPFEEGAGDKALDASGNKNDGVIKGSPKWVASIDKFGKGLQFDGTVVVTAPHVPFDNRSFTIMMWMNPINDKRQEFFTQNQSGATNLSLHLRLGGPAGDSAPANGVRYGFYGNDLDSPINVIKANTWVHLTFWYDKAKPTRKLYVNGEVVGTDSGAPYQGTTGDTVLGEWTGVDPNWHYKGILDDVRIYDYAVADDLIKKNMASPSGLAVASNGKLATTWGEMKSGR
ncbi:MAG: LamG domain-containing protein [Candidatus Poribacteria bacterium]